MDSLLRNNNIVRLIAFVIAVMLWFVVRGGAPVDGNSKNVLANTSETVTVPVHILYNQQRLSLQNPPKSVNLLLHGDRLSVLQAKIQPNTITATIDARSLPAGVFTVPVQVTGLMPGVEFDPVQLKVSLENNISKQFPVEILLDNTRSTPDGTHQIDYDPKNVTIYGAESVVHQIQHVRARFPISGDETQKQKRTVVLYAVNGAGDTVDVQIQPATVNVTVYPTQKKVPMSFKIKGWPANGWAVGDITPKQMDVNILGKVSDINEIPVSLDVTGMDHSDNKVVVLTPFGGLTGIQPSEISVAVEIVKAQQRDVSDVPITVTGVPSGMTATLQSSTLQVKIEGAPSRLQSLSKDNVKAVADIKNMGVGTYQAAITIQVPNGVRVVSGQNLTAQVTIEKSAP